MKIKTSHQSRKILETQTADKRLVAKIPKRTPIFLNQWEKDLKSNWKISGN